MTYFKFFSKVDSDHPNSQNPSFKVRFLVIITEYWLGSVFSDTPSTPFEVVFQAHLNRVNLPYQASQVGRHT